MRHLYYLLLLSLLAGSLPACVGGKPKPSPAVYDFGLISAKDATTMPETKVQIDHVTAAESLNSNRIRYRLNYQNPARVFSYTESRWAALPAELLSAKLRASSKTILANCSLKLQVEAFDQVFDSETASHGVIQLGAILSDTRTRAVIAKERFEETAVAPTPDAKGGVAALNQASSAAISKVLNWGNAAAEKSEACR